MSHVYTDECCCVDCVYIRQEQEKARGVLQREGQLEIERRWLLEWDRILPNLDELPKDYIAQGYITPANRSELNLPNATFRVRKRGDAYFFTRKFGVGILVRSEAEVQLTEEQFSLMWGMVGQQYVQKNRYYLKHNLKTIEMDFFEGKLDGLIIAEIEFDSKEEAEEFKAPDWFGKEITEDARYTNYSLALNGRP